MKQVTSSIIASLMAILPVAGGCYTVNSKPPTDAQRADDLARSVAMASGANNLPRASTVAFTCVERDGTDVKTSRQHLWNIKDGTDTVSSGEKSTTVNVNKPDMDDPAQAEAYKAWSNDSYWLLAPLGLFDKGVTREALGRREVAGKTYEVLRVKGGMTPGDGNDLYIDPFTSLVAYSDSMPSPEMTSQTTWQKYRHVEGMKLATFHQMGTKSIAIENLSVASE